MKNTLKYKRETWKKEQILTVREPQWLQKASFSGEKFQYAGDN
jgi:hypothetical protein